MSSLPTLALFSTFYLPLGLLSFKQDRFSFFGIIPIWCFLSVWDLFWCLTSHKGNSQSLSFHVFLHFLYLFLLIFSLHAFYTFCRPTVFGYSLLFPSVFCPACFSVLQISLEIPISSEILSSAVSSPLLLHRRHSSLLWQ